MTRTCSRLMTGVWVCIALLPMGFAGVARSDEPPKTPDTAPAEQRRPPPGAIINRLIENLGKLDLTADQQQKVDALLDDTKKQLQGLREQMSPDADRRVMADKAREIFGSVRQKLQEILTPDQQLKLRDLTQKQTDERNTAAAKPSEQPKPSDVAKPKSAPSMDDTMQRPVPAPTPVKAKTDPTVTRAVEPGQIAPAFSLKNMSDRPVTLESFKGRVVILVFGSYSTPSFRQRIPSLEKLAKEYSTRATILIIYTREAHAVGEWEVDRNKEESIAVEQPKTDAERKVLANQAVNTLKISVPVLVDGMDNAVTNAYGLVPNGAVVINRDGTVAARQHWFEPIGLRPQIDTAISVHPAKE